MNLSDKKQYWTARDTRILQDLIVDKSYDEIVKIIDDVFVSNEWSKKGSIYPQIEVEDNIWISYITPDKMFEIEQQ